MEREKNRHYRVVADVPTRTNPTHGLLRGVIAFARTRHDWSLMLAQRRETPLRFEAGTFAPDGVISYLLDTSPWQNAVRRGLPLVGGALAPNARRFAATISCDNDSVARLAAEHLASRGFRHFAFAGGVGRYPWRHERREAFRREMRNRGFDPDVFVFGPTPGTAKESRAERARVEAWLLALPKPVGLFADCDLLALDLIDACRASGLDVPGDVAVLGVDDDPLLCETASPTLSSVVLDVEAAGFAAAEALDAAMRGEPVKNRRIRFGGVRVRARESTARFVGRDGLVAKANSLVREGLGGRLSVAEMARTLGVSRRTLEARFKAETGVPIGESIIRARLAKARELLSDTILPHEEIADACGLSSASHMASLFRRRFGAPPSAFRAR
jgi:LacI family transcriptional regulator